MLANWVGITATILYFAGLFALARFGDRKGARFIRGPARKAIYVLGLGVYCTSWTFFGSVGLASSNGLDFLPIYLGPMLVFGFGWPIVARVARLAHAQNTTSIADFLAARYGKSEAVAALVAIISVIGLVPYIALQLKAISACLVTGLSWNSATSAAHATLASGDGADRLTILSVFLLAGFAMAFGTRRIDAGEHQHGLMLTIAAESVIKLLAFLAVGAFVTWWQFDGLGDLTQRALSSEHIRAVFTAPPDFQTWVTLTLLSCCAILFLPRQFHVAIVENNAETDIRSAAVTFPLYLIAINFFVVPLAIAGLVLFPGVMDRDLSVMALPIAAGNGLMSWIAMLGGLSAATAMVVIESVALSIMVSNDLVIPLLLRLGRWRHGCASGHSMPVLAIRRVAIVVVLLLAYAYFKMSGEALLASIGILSFACVAQLAPAFIGALTWNRGTSLGAIAGLITGVTIWAYTLLAPSLDAGLMQQTLRSALFPPIPGLAPPDAFSLQMPTLVHGVFWSLLGNCLAFVGFSLVRRPTPIERLQADIFVGNRVAPMAQAFRIWRSSVPAADVEATVARYLGAERTHEAFETFYLGRGLKYDARAEADIHLLRIAEHLLASAIGAASSRLVLSLLLRRRNVSGAAALRLVDDASAALLYNRDMLQHALDFARQGISVFDADLRMTCWNREFRDMYDLPASFTRVGVALDDILRFNATRGLYGPGPVDELVASRLECLTQPAEPLRLPLFPSKSVIETRSARMPDGGLVITYTDVTDQALAEQTLEAANETLERRVRERTEELTRLNEELARAKAGADEANISKTRFLAAAGHDILQPLNAARLYTASLLQRIDAGAPLAEAAPLARNVDAALEAVEDIFSALLEMSRLDAGAMKVDLSNFRIDDLFRQLKIEFTPLAEERGLKLIFSPCSLTVRSDRRLLRRLLQNLISNAIKYTKKGGVLVGVRRLRGRMRIEVWDSGIGIPEDKQTAVFREFERLEPGMRTAPGLGLGLSIVERMARVLGHAIRLRSRPEQGSVFTVEAPIAAPTPVLPERRVAAPPPRNSPLAGMVVVAIDNEPRIIDGMRALLEGWGCVPVVALNQRDAIVALAQLRRAPDALLADFHLDEGDGVDAIVALRWKFGLHLPAALITADRSEEMRLRASEKDVLIVNKPLKPAVLRALLAQWRSIAPASDSNSLADGLGNDGM